MPYKVDGWDEILNLFSDIVKAVTRSKAYKEAYFCISEIDFPFSDYADGSEIYRINSFKIYDTDIQTRLELNNNMFTEDYPIIMTIGKHLQLMEEVIQQQDSKDLDDLLSELVDYAEEIDIDIGLQIEDMLSILDSLNNESANLIYSVPRDIIRIDTIYTSIKEVIKTINVNKTDIYKLTSRKFEELIFEIFISQGFVAELTKQTRDGGYDIIAFTNIHDIPLKYLIECKRYSEQRKVDISLVQRLFGVKQSNFANKAILVTTSTFTSDARVYAQKHYWDLSLKDKHDVFNWIDNYCRIKG